MILVVCSTETTPQKIKSSFEVDCCVGGARHLSEQYASELQSGRPTRFGDRCFTASIDVTGAAKMLELVGLI